MVIALYHIIKGRLKGFYQKNNVANDDDGADDDGDDGCDDDGGDGDGGW